MMTAEENLARLEIALPSPPAAVANYVAWVRTGNLIVTSGQLPWVGMRMQYAGRCGAELSDEQGYAAARLCAINAIAQLKDAVGDLERVVQLVRLEGNVYSAVNYKGQPQVLNGASDLMVEVFEQRGRHTRSTLGISEMPLGAAVQLTVWAEIRPE
jgi:enamine deaminase RidA (YjgF/YER057c/UK114 family)